MSKQNKYLDVMIDIETASTKYDACVLSIGIVKFNLFDSEVERDKLELLIYLDSCVEAGLRVSEDTMEWWATQDKNVYNHVFNEGPRYSLIEGIRKMNEFISDPTIERYWSQGSFDFIVLENAMNKVEIEPIWKYYQLRDARTISKMVENLPRKPKNAHSAIVDCDYQIDVLHHVYEELNIKPIKRKNRIVFDYSKDWLCGCGAGNFAYRKSCYKCNKQKLTEK